MIKKRTLESQGTPLSMEDASSIADTFRALADPTRLRIVSMLAQGERCVHDVCEALELEQSAVSHQLRVLRDRRIVRSRREGRHIYYSLDDEHIEELLENGRQHQGHTGGRQ